MTKKNIVRVHMKGVDRHELVELEVFNLPKTIRKIYGIAVTKQEAEFFKILGFKQEAKFNIKKVKLFHGVYSFYTKQKITNKRGN